MDALIHNKRHLSVTLKPFSLRKEKLSKIRGNIDQLKDMMIVKLLSKPSSNPPATEKPSVKQDNGHSNVKELKDNMVVKLLTKPTSCPPVDEKICSKPEKVNLVKVKFV